MNQEQINSLARSIMKILAGLLAAHGLQNEATLLNTPDVISAVLLIISLAWSHFAHATPADPPTPPASPTISALMAVGVAALLFANATGCTSTPQTVAYRTAGTAVVSVDTAMTLWGQYVATYHPNANQEATVKAAYDKYQAAMVAVCDAGAIYAASGSTNAPAGAALNQAIANSGQDLIDLENLLTDCGIKLK
jgi:hypothetical protein